MCVCRERRTVLFNYDPVNDDELRLTVGDIVEVEECFEDGWVRRAVPRAHGPLLTTYVCTQAKGSINGVEGRSWVELPVLAAA